MIALLMVEPTIGAYREGQEDATSSIGHTSAISTACSEIQEPVCHPGFMKSCRMAEVVAETDSTGQLSNQDGMWTGSRRRLREN